MDSRVVRNKKTRDVENRFSTVWMGENMFTCWSWCRYLQCAAAEGTAERTRIKKGKEQKLIKEVHRGGGDGWYWWWWGFASEPKPMKSQIGFGWVGGGVGGSSRRHCYCHSAAPAPASHPVHQSWLKLCLPER